MILIYDIHEHHMITFVSLSDISTVSKGDPVQITKNAVFLIQGPLDCLDPDTSLFDNV